MAGTKDVGVVVEGIRVDEACVDGGVVEGSAVEGVVDGSVVDGETCYQIKKENLIISKSKNRGKNLKKVIFFFFAKSRALFESPYF